MYLVEAREHGFQVLVEHGGALGDWHEQHGGERALRRSARVTGSILFSEPDPSLAIHAASQSGLVVPLFLPGARGPALGFVVLESTRRRDFLVADRERIERSIAGFVRAYRAAQFVAWHQERFAVELAWDPGSNWLAAREDPLRAAARSRAPLALVGPVGSGKRTLARWLHFEGKHPERELLEGTGEPPAAGTWVLELDALPADEQLELARGLERGLEARVILLARTPLASALERGLLRPELVRAFERLAFELPRLCDRRDEIPGLISALLRRCAREEGLAVPVLADETIALLWRQSWPGNVRELGALVFKLVLRHPGREIAPEHVLELCRALGQEPRERLPSRRPRKLDLQLALHTTAHQSGTWNRARAARYLGWDPDTLDARLGELEIDEPGTDPPRK